MGGFVAAEQVRLIRSTSQPLFIPQVCVLFQGWLGWVISILRERLTIFKALFLSYLSGILFIWSEI